MFRRFRRLCRVAVGESRHRQHASLRRTPVDADDAENDDDVVVVDDDFRWSLERFQWRRGKDRRRGNGCGRIQKAASAADEKESILENSEILRS